MLVPQARTCTDPRRREPRASAEQHRVEPAGIDDAHGVADDALLVDLFCMKWRYGPSSSEASETSETCTARDGRIVGIEHPHRIAAQLAVSPSRRSPAVAETIAETSEATSSRRRPADQQGQPTRAPPWGIAPVDHRQRVGTVQLLHRLLQRRSGSRLRAVVVDEVGDDFGIGLRFEP